MTVKRNGNRVILKDGKVSCSCCDTECCMYPSQALADGLYTIDDLPNTVVNVSSDDPPRVLVYTKLSSPTPSQDPSVGAISYYHAIDENNILQGIGIRDGGSWVGSEIASEDAEYGQCLLSIAPLNPPEPLNWRALEDQFASSYFISGPISGTVTRMSVCTWEGDGLRLVNFNYRWRLNGNAKSGFQNTPVGSYAGGFTVS